MAPIHEADKILATAPELPENHPAASEEILSYALAHTVDLIKLCIAQLVVQRPLNMRCS